LDGLLKKKKNFLVDHKYKALVYCPDSHSEIDLAVIKNVIKSQGELLSLAIDDCNSSDFTGFSFVNELLKKLEGNNKTIGLVKFLNEEIELYEKEGLDLLEEFVKKSKKEILFRLTHSTMNRIIG
jgi:hypothetical protein